MTVSHRKFGDLLEEGIKRVHITRKKPIGYILDEFGYELRPDDSTKGRYSLGHWYYKKRIPASMDDVATLARLILTNSDVERNWLKAFLESAGYVNADAFCDQFFIPERAETQEDVQVEPPRASVAPVAVEETVESRSQPAKPTRLQFVYVGGTLLLLLISTLLIMRSRAIRATFSGVNPTQTNAIQSLPSVDATAPLKQATETSVPVATSVVVSVSPTADFATFNGKCPSIASLPAFEYRSPESFANFLNTGGSFTALKSGFDILAQKKEMLKDGRLSSSDLTGDGVPEVIVSAILDRGSAWQILGCDSGQYKPLIDRVDSGFRYFRFAVDLNGNKFPEVISYRQTQVESVDMYEFFVQEWNGDQIVDRVDNTRFEKVGKRLPADITDWQRTVANATVTTRDTNGDSLFEIIFTGGLITPVPTCDTRFERQFTETWAWSGQSMQLVERVYIPPIYRFQRSADGDLAFALKQFDRALDAYQDVLFDANLYRRDQYLPHLDYCSQMEPSTDLRSAKDELDLLQAYARWRILLINALQGSEDATQVVYETLQEKFPKGKPGQAYTVIASEFWNRYQSTQDIDEACDAANIAAKNQTLYVSHNAENMCFIP